jgi:ABC-type nitrate/sulfonate/bicarbonate transport system substrate-binding protein
MPPLARASVPRTRARAARGRAARALGVVGVIAAASAALLAGASARGGRLVREAHAQTKPTLLRVGIEREGDLRLLALWVAIGNGDFRRAGLEVVPVVLGARVGEALRSGEVQIAAVRPALWAPLVTGDGLAGRTGDAGLVGDAGRSGDRGATLIAALLRNDDCNLIVQKKQLERRGLDGSAIGSTALGVRLDALRELRLGYVGTSASHVAALLGERATRVRLVELDEGSADGAFASGDVDALFAPSPWAERAMLSADGALLVHASAGTREHAGGELPLLDAAVATRAFVQSDEARLDAFVKAIALAEQLVHDERSAAVHALVEARPSADRALLEAAVLLYEPAVPRDPRLDLAMVTATLGAVQPPIDLAKLDVGKTFDPRFAQRAVGNGTPPRLFMKILGAVLGVVIGGVITFIVLYRKKSSEPQAGGGAGDDAAGDA